MSTVDVINTLSALEKELEGRNSIIVENYSGLFDAAKKVIETFKKCEVITIDKKEYDELCEKEVWLSWLEAAGVDNWEGYEFAQEEYQKDKRNDVSN